LRTSRRDCSPLLTSKLNCKMLLDDNIISAVRPESPILMEEKNDI
jgi:hypothetical protein